MPRERGGRDAKAAGAVVHFGVRWHPAESSDHRAYQLPRACQPQRRGEEAGWKIRELWLEVPLPDGWIAAYRLVPQDGAPVVAELRIFPGVRADATGRRAGYWAAEILGDQVGEHVEVPRGGLPARVLREVRLLLHREYMREILAYQHARHGDTLFTPVGLYGRHGLTTRALGPAPHPGGRRRRSERDYAAIAAAYDAAVQAGSRRPAADVARRLGMKPATVADLVHRARVRGLLTPVKQGASGGTLTPKARALLGLDASGPPPTRPARRTTQKGRR